MSKLTDLCMAGVELRDPTRAAPVLLDFCVSNRESTLCLIADWWTASWGMGESLIAVRAPLSEALQFDGLPSGGLSLGLPTDEGLADRARAMRDRMDFNRPAYYMALARLGLFEPEFDLTDWTEAVMARPDRDPFAELTSRNAALRAIGEVRLCDHTGQVVDALALDELGNAATFQDDGWLALFAAQWSGYAEDARPDLETFLDWVSQQSPYGAFRLERPRVVADQGSLQARVTRALTQTTS